MPVPTTCTLPLAYEVVVVRRGEQGWRRGRCRGGGPGRVRELRPCRPARQGAARRLRGKHEVEFSGNWGVPRTSTKEVKGLRGALAVRASRLLAQGPVEVERGADER